MGRTLEAFYHTFGDYGVVAIAEIPDPESAAALSLAVNTNGLVYLGITVLLTPEQLDGSTKKVVNYRPPRQ